MVKEGEAVQTAGGFLRHVGHRAEAAVLMGKCRREAQKFIWGVGQSLSYPLWENRW
jgi:hypothetical protein